MQKRGLLFFLICCLFLCASKAPAMITDSIRLLEQSLVEKIPDTARLRTLISLSEFYMGKQKHP